METNTNIKIVRLQSGEDIIANYFVDDENGTIMLDNPMHIIFKRNNNGQTVMMMMPWLPVEIIKQNHAIIDMADILTIIDPKENLITHYGNTVIEIMERISAKEMEEELDDGEDDEEELDLENLMEIMHQKRKSNLH